MSTKTKDRVRLIACDIDGTLVSGGQIVSPELKDLFAGLARRGVQATLCTGRMPHYTVGVADQLGLTEYLICTEGGHVFHRATGEKVHYAAMDEQVIEAVDSAVRQTPGVELMAISDDTLWASSPLAAQRGDKWGNRWRAMDSVRDVPGPVLCVLFGPHRAMDRLAGQFRDRLPADKAFVHDPEDQGDYAHFKVCSPETDKGVGAEKLVQRLGGDRSQILAFGDYLNDMGIMKHAGQSICPRNAHPAVRQAATRVSPYSTEEGFVAREIERIFGFA